MANTYSKIYIQLIFAVKNRQPLLVNQFKNDICKYITGIIQKNNHKPLAINGYRDHIHIFLGYNPDSNLSDLVRDIKSNSTRFINKKYEIGFKWQNGFGAFSYSASQKNNVIKYILNQELHHRTRTSKEEYLIFLKKYEVEYKNEYLFE